MRGRDTADGKLLARPDVPAAIADKAATAQAATAQAQQQLNALVNRLDGSASPRACALAGSVEDLLREQGNLRGAVESFLAQVQAA